MGKNQMAVLVLLLVAAMAASGYEGEAERGSEGRKMFVLHADKEVVKTDAGFIKVVRGVGGRLLHIGFITMEPQSLLVPQYLDSHLVLFIRQGEARIGHIYNDELVDKELKSGDVYTVEAGSAFYLVNTAGGQRLHIICAIDSSQSLQPHTFQPFFIGGGTHPTSVLAGFGTKTLSTALNVSVGEVGQLLGAKLSGPIVHLNNNTQYSSPTVWTLNREQRLAQLKRILHSEAVDDEEEEHWAWLGLGLLRKMFSNKKDKEAPDSYNIYDSDADFSNEFGWSKAVDQNDHSPLAVPDVTVFLVNLTAGAMMAPHINPRAAEYGIVLKGSGTVQIVYPNGTLAMNTEVGEGDVFWVPRFFPFCQIASRNGPFLFFGFTTSCKDNKPQFLAGQGSVMQRMKGPELATALGLTEERLAKILDAQTAQTILPSASAAPPKRGGHDV